MIYTVTLNTSIDRTIEVERFKPADVNLGRLVRTLPAGKGMNVSRILNALGSASVATGFVGKKELSSYEESVAGTSIEIDFVVLNASTRENVTIVDRSSAEDTHIRETGPEIGREQIQLLSEKLRKRLTEKDKVIFAGSMPPGFSAGDFEEMLEIPSGAGAQTYLDAGGGILRTCSKYADIIKPNFAELQEMLESSEEDILDLLSQLRTVRSKPSLITCGADGAYYVDGSICIHASADTEGLVPVNSVGCGDAFLAGFIHSAEAAQSNEEALRLALSCGTACILSATADIRDTSLVGEIAQRVACRSI